MKQILVAMLLTLLTVQPVCSSSSFDLAKKYVVYASSGLLKETKICFTDDPKKADFKILVVDGFSHGMVPDKTIFVSQSQAFNKRKICFSKSSIKKDRTVKIVGEDDANLVIFMTKNYFDCREYDLKLRVTDYIRSSFDEEYFFTDDDYNADVVIDVESSH